MRTRVLLPAPFSPTRAWTSPARRSNETPRNARTPPKALPMSRSSSRGGASAISVPAALDVEDLAQVACDGTVVGIRRHQLAHVAPPAPADLGGGDGTPALLAVDLGVAEQLARLRIEVDGVVAHAVRVER